MNLKDEVKWKEYVEINKDNEYSKCCVDVACRVMELLDDCADFNCHDLICKANKEIDGDITGFMAGCVAQMVSECHVRGEEFRQKWNRDYGVSEDKGGVVNPALLTIEV